MSLIDVAVAEYEHYLTQARRPTAFADSIIREGWDAKAKLRKALGMDNSGRVILSSTVDSAALKRVYPDTIYALRRSLCGIDGINLNTLDLGTMTVEVKEQKRRLGRLLNRHFTDLHFEICKLELKLDDRSQFLPRLGEINKPDSLLVLSVNPLDILLSTDNSSFTSCHSLDGCHYNGNIAYVRDEVTAIVYVMKADQQELLTAGKLPYKSGRCWMYLVPDKVISIAKAYGSVTSTDRKAAMDYVQPRLLGGIGDADLSSYSSLDYDWLYRYFDTEDGSDETEAAYYLDNYDMMVLVNDSAKHCDEWLITEAARCLSCGNTTTNQEAGVCNECLHDNRCDCCGGYAHDLQDGPHGDQICDYCMANETTECPECGDIEYHFNLHAVRNSVDMCRSCMDKHAFRCYDCWNYHLNEDGVDIPNDTMHCSECAERHHRCGQCGELKRVVYSNGLCSICEEASPKQDIPMKVGATPLSQPQQLETAW